MPEQITAEPHLLSCFWCRDLITEEVARTETRKLPVHVKCKSLEDEHQAVYDRAREKAGA